MYLNLINHLCTTLPASAWSSNIFLFLSFITVFIRILDCGKNEVTTG